MTIDRLMAEYRTLGVRQGTDVLLPLPAGTSPTSDEAIRLRAIELARPFIALVRRHGYPLGRVYLVAANSMEALRQAIPKTRIGPNGPIDGVSIRRR